MVNLDEAAKPEEEVGEREVVALERKIDRPRLVARAGCALPGWIESNWTPASGGLLELEDHAGHVGVIGHCLDDLEEVGRADLLLGPLLRELSRQ